MSVQKIDIASMFPRGNWIATAFKMNPDSDEVYIGIDFERCNDAESNAQINEHKYIEKFNEYCDTYFNQYKPVRIHVRLYKRIKSNNPNMSLVAPSAHVFPYAETFKDRSGNILSVSEEIMKIVSNGVQKEGIFRTIAGLIPAFEKAGISPAIVLTLGLRGRACGDTG